MEVVGLLVIVRLHLAVMEAILLGLQLQDVLFIMEEGVVLLILVVCLVMSTIKNTVQQLATELWAKVVLVAIIVKGNIIMVEQEEDIMVEEVPTVQEVVEVPASRIILSSSLALTLDTGLCL